jgi:hypothetical protein
MKINSFYFILKLTDLQEKYILLLMNLICGMHFWQADSPLFQNKLLLHDKIHNLKLWNNLVP